MFASAITELKQRPLLRWYLFAEAVALTVAVVSITLASRLTENTFILIAASVYSGSAGYYSVLFVYRLYAERHSQRTGHDYCL